MAELTVPSLDFTPLANLGNVYRQAQADAMRRNTLAQLGQGGTADAAALLRSGDLSLAQLGINMQNRQADLERQARQDAFQREEAARAQKNADRAYGLQARAAARADEGPVEQAAYRAKVAQQYGIDPNSAEGKAFIVSGRLPESATTGGITGLAAQRAELLRQHGVDPASPEGRNYIISGEWTGQGAGKNGLQPIYGTDAQGKPVIMQMNPSGTATKTQLPDGVTVSRDPIKIDRGTDFLLLDPITRQPIGTIPKDLAGAETAKVVGEETGKAQVALPQVLSTAQQTLKSIEDVRNHPGRQYATGSLGTIPGIPGTSQRGFIAALDQLKGKTFLEAFNALRGGGAITEAEGAKATNAMARLDRAQNKEDFEAALNDLRDVVTAGMARARAKAKGAGGGTPAASGASTAAPQSFTTANGVSWSIQ